MATASYTTPRDVILPGGRGFLFDADASLVAPKAVDVDNAPQ